MEGVLAGELGHVLVAGDTRGLESLAGDVFLLPRDEVDAEGELVDPLLLHPDVVDSDLGVGHTAAEAGLGVGLVLDLAVAPGWSASHGGGFGSLLKTLDFERLGVEEENGGYAIYIYYRHMSLLPYF